MTWHISKVWNDTLDSGEERELTARDNIWASELGGAHIDRWKKMRAHPYSNPPNARARRKFESGNLVEWVVKMILNRAGIMQATQDRQVFGYPGLLKVTGRLDFVAGGKPNYDEARDVIQALQLPPFFTTVGDNIINYLNEKYPDGLEQIVLEVKSVSSMMFDVYELNGASLHHKLQNFHYLKSLNFPEGHILYICRDDMRVLEYTVLLTDPELEKIYHDDIEAMTKAYNSEEQPPLEPTYVWQPERLRFAANYKVGYSPYITELYGYADQTAFQDATKAQVARWNRVIGRIKKEEKLTKNNLEAIRELAKAGVPYPPMVEEALRREGYDLEQETATA